MAGTADVLAGSATWGVDNADALAWARTLPDNSVHCIVTSPPYYALRDYGVAGQMGLEASPAEYVAGMVGLFRVLRRVLHPSGTCWVNIGDSYARGNGSKNGQATAGAKQQTNRGAMAHNKSGKIPFGFKDKDRLMIPARLAIALQADGWYLRDEIVWHKPSPMPSSVRDRTTCAHEMIYLLTKSPRYFYDAEAIAEKSVAGANGSSFTRGKTLDAAQQRSPVGQGLREDSPTRNKRSVWRVASTQFKGSHFACYPPKLILPCIRAGSSERGVCPACGEPWRRVVKKDRKATRPGTDTKTTGDGMTDGNRDPHRHVTTTETVGWQSGCGCDAGEPVPSVVLDPFAGSGTTIQVAVQEGRRAVGCELNPAYLKLIDRRMFAVTPSLLAGV